jgi:hypothetical protein
LNAKLPDNSQYKHPPGCRQPAAACKYADIGYILKGLDRTSSAPWVSPLKNRTIRLHCRQRQDCGSGEERRMTNITDPFTEMSEAPEQIVVAVFPHPLHGRLVERIILYVQSSIRFQGFRYKLTWWGDGQAYYRVISD